METAATILAVTFTLGFVASLLRLPPMVGFLAAGFALNALGIGDVAWVDTLGDLGVTLLLFAIGLKLDVRSLLGREVWLTTGVALVVHVTSGVALLALLGWLGVGLAAGMSIGSMAVVALGLAFSSTVFVIKILDERGDATTFYGRIAIGVLVMQDIVAVAFLSATTGTLPSPWALTLVLLWPATRLLRPVWQRIGHGEMQTLFGILMALVPGYLLFDHVGLKGDLGALVMGALLASFPSSSELSRSLFHLKELLLVGFFLSIGMSGGLPSASEIGLAAALLLLLPVQTISYVGALWTMRVRHRTSWLAAFSLTQFSEFGLILVSVGSDNGLLDPGWLLVMSVAVSLAFVIAALLNGVGQPLVEHLAEAMPHQDPSRLHPEDRPADVSGASALVVGLGRVGRNAYQQLTAVHGLSVVGMDTDRVRLEKLENLGMRVVEGDGSDEEFFARLNGREDVQIVVVALPANCAEAVATLRATGFAGTIATAARYEDDVQAALAAGADTAFNAYGGTGLELADQAVGIHRHDPRTGPIPTVD